MSTSNGEINNNHIEEMRSLQRERVKRQGLNHVKEILEMERTQKRIEKMSSEDCKDNK